MSSAGQATSMDVDSTHQSKQKSCPILQSFDSHFITRVARPARTQFVKHGMTPQGRNRAFNSKRTRTFAEVPRPEECGLESRCHVNVARFRIKDIILETCTAWLKWFQGCGT